MEYLTDGSNAVEVMEAPTINFIDLHPGVPRGSPAEIRYKERRAVLERQILAIYKKIKTVENHIERVRPRLLGELELSQLTWGNSESELRDYIMSLNESTRKSKYLGEIQFREYDESVNELNSHIGFVISDIIVRAMTQEQYNDALNGVFKLRDETLSTDCLKNYPGNIPKPSDYGLTEVVGDQLDPNVENPVEERPSILFGDSTEYKAEMKKLAERFGGK